MKKLILGLILTLFCLDARASTYVPCAEDEAETCWPCGETCSARLTYANEQDAQNKTNATLTFSGTGKTDDYVTPSGNPELIGVEPWWNVRNSISKVIVDEGITGLGDKTIYWMENLQEVVLPESLEEIGVYAFHGTTVPVLVIPQNVLPDKWIFGDYSHIDKVYCEENIQDQCEAAVDVVYKHHPESNINLISYETTKDGQYFYNGRWYNSAKDIAGGNHIKKLRYTVEEAMKVTEKGDKFHVYLTYK